MADALRTTMYVDLRSAEKRHQHFANLVRQIDVLVRFSRTMRKHNHSTGKLTANNGAESKLDGKTRRRGTS